MYHIHIYIYIHYIYITLHYISLHYITFHYITLHYITLHTYIHYIHRQLHTYIRTYCIPLLKHQNLPSHRLISLISENIFWFPRSVTEDGDISNDVSHSPSKQRGISKTGEFFPCQNGEEVCLKVSGWQVWNCAVSRSCGCPNRALTRLG